MTEPYWTEARVRERVRARGRGWWPVELSWDAPEGPRFDAAGLWVRGELLAWAGAVPGRYVGRRGPRPSGAWVDETVAVDPVVAERLLARPRDLVDACVAVTLREPTWLR